MSEKIPTIALPYDPSRGVYPNENAAAVIDVELEDDGRTIRRVFLALGPAWDPTTDAQAYVHREVLPRINRLLTAEALDHDPWAVVSTGHLQLTLVQHLLPTMGEAASRRLTVGATGGQVAFPLVGHDDREVDR